MSDCRSCVLWKEVHTTVRRLRPTVLAIDRDLANQSRQILAIAQVVHMMYCLDFAVVKFLGIAIGRMMLIQKPCT